MNKNDIKMIAEAYVKIYEGFGDDIDIDQKTIGQPQKSTRYQSAGYIGGGDSSIFPSEKTITKVEELKALPEKSIIWYPEHSDSMGSFLTRNALLTYLNQDIWEDERHEPVLSDEFNHIVQKDVARFSNPKWPHLQAEEGAPIITIAYGNGNDKMEMSLFIEALKRAGYRFFTVDYVSPNDSDPRNIRSKWNFD